MVGSEEDADGNKEASPNHEPQADPGVHSGNLCAVGGRMRRGLGPLQVYIVQPGDTLARTAAAHHATVDKLVELNRETYPSLATDPDAIEAGWKLRAPSSGEGIQVAVRKTPSLQSGPTTIRLDRDAFEMEVVHLVHEERTKARLASLVADPRLVEIARVRSSQDMVEKSDFSHYGLSGDYLVMQLVPKHGIDGWVWENSTRLLRTMAVTPGNAARAVSNWMNSRDHRKVPMEPFLHHTGVGMAIGENTIIVNQLFAE